MGFKQQTAGWPSQAVPAWYFHGFLQRKIRPLQWCVANVLSQRSHKMFPARCYKSKSAFAKKKKKKGLWNLLFYLNSWCAFLWYKTKKNGKKKALVRCNASSYRLLLVNMLGIFAEPSLCTGTWASEEKRCQMFSAERFCFQSARSFVRPEPFQLQILHSL